MDMNAQFTFRVLPGIDLPAAFETINTAGRLWKVRGADPSLWVVRAGEIRNMMFTARFGSNANCGKCYDVMLADPEFRQWQVDASKSGMYGCVRSNVAWQVPLD